MVDGTEYLNTMDNKQSTRMHLPAVRHKLNDILGFVAFLDSYFCTGTVCVYVHLIYNDVITVRNLHKFRVDPFALVGYDG